MAERKFDFNSGAGVEPASGNGDDGGSIAGFIDPAAATGTGSTDSGTSGAPDGTGKRKRGRPRGTGNSASASKGTAKNAFPLSVNGVETILLSVHTILASAISCPELLLDQKEANAIADGVAKVAAEYDVRMDPKTAAWINLATVASAVYGPRGIAIFVRVSSEKPARTTAPATNRNAPPPNVDLSKFDPTKISMPN